MIQFSSSDLTSGSVEINDMRVARVSGIFQPFDLSHSDALTELFGGSFERGILSSAYVRESGVIAIADELRKGAGRIVAFVGIRNGSTSIQGLEALLQTGVQTFVVDTGSRGILFHPKVYLVEKGRKASAIIGSSNLTHSGLNNNVEVGVRLELDARVANEKKFLDALRKTFEDLPLVHPDNCFRIGSVADVAKLRPLLIDEWAETKSDAAELRGKVRQGNGGKRIKLKFIPPPRRIRPQATKVIRKARSRAAVGSLVWEKVLPTGDLQILTQGHTTGVLRLTQAGFRLLGRRIDQTRYFRHDIFKRLRWAVDPNDRGKETASAKFRLVLRGKDQGEFDLKLSHKPAWESSQRNYTTALHWGDAVGLVKRPDLVGATIRLYGPRGRQRDFTLRID